jgi:predicted permease
MATRPDPIRRLYRALLALYPSTFRARYDEELLEAFDDRRSEKRFRGPFGGMRLVAFLLNDLARSLPMARHHSPTQTTTVHRTVSVEGIMGDFVRDLKFSFRMLIKSPVFTVAAITTLALGIGLNAATFSAVSGVLLRPLGGTESPEELVQLYREWPGIEWGSTSVPHYQDLRDRSVEVFENMALWNFAPMSLSADERSERLVGMVVSANFFQTLGTRPVLGRGFIPGTEDKGPGAHPVVVLGHGFWQARFGGDPEVLGSTIILNGSPFEIVGVSDPEFRGPVNYASVPIYVPLMMLETIQPGSELLVQRGSNSMTAVARLRDGVSLEQAQDRVDAVLAQLGEEYPESYEGQIGTRIIYTSEAGLHPSFGAAQSGMSAVMMAVVGLLLLIACVNVANLFLARARDRRREIGVRLSLGAGRGRIVRQLLTESLLFSLLAGAAGLGLAQVATRLLANFQLPIDGPWAMDVAIDGSVLWFTFGVSVVAGLVFGMAPALQAAKSSTVAAIKGSASGRAGSSRTSSALVVVQMALSLLLLISAGLFLRSLQGAMRIDPGFDTPSNLAMASLDPGLQGYDQPSTEAFYARLLDRIEGTPEISSAALVRTAPLSLGSSDRGVAIPGYEFAEGERNSLFYTEVSQGYFETMGIQLLEGRAIDRSDDTEGAPVIVVNQRFADRFWPGESALGRIVQTAGAERAVIGVVETGKYNSLGEDPAEFMYLSHHERFTSNMTIVARTPSDPQAALRAIQRLVREADSDMPLYDVRTMADHMGIALLPARLGGSMLGLFGLLGLTLAAVGIYGVMAYSVSQRRRELGIRVALGADRSGMVRMVVTEGMRLAVVGTVIGLVAAFAAAQLVKGLLYDIQPIDPVAFLSVPLLLIAVSGLAVYLPARQAARVDPMRALKSE